MSRSLETGAEPDVCERCSTSLFDDEVLRGVCDDCVTFADLLRECRPMALFVASAPDSLGRVTYFLYWTTNYIRGHCEGDLGGHVQRQVYFDVPPRDVPQPWESEPTREDLRGYFYPAPVTCQHCDGTGVFVIDPALEPFTCRGCGGTGRVQTHRPWRPMTTDPGPDAWFDQTFTTDDIPF